jgi:hypothetical protein
MDTSDSRTAAIETLGYTPREAAFLACVTRHGGYFLRRQFLTWMEYTKGRAVVVFTRRLLARRHATRQTFCRQTQVYHLAAQVLYDGVPDVSPRDRRRRSALAIKSRLMALDFAMMRPDLQVLASEQERLRYCERLGIDHGRLPKRVWRPYRAANTQRVFFPEPIILAIQDADTSAPTVVCAHVDDGACGVAGFETFLRRHARFLAAIPRWQVIYLAQHQRQLTAATAAFARSFAKDPSLARMRDVAEIGEYFRLRRLYEREAWGELKTEGSTLVAAL